MPRPFSLLILLSLLASTAFATPANKERVQRQFGDLLPAKLHDCTLCHQAGAHDEPDSLAEIPHNAFGAALRKIGKTTSLPQRVLQLADADTDGDGVDNLSEILLGSFPADATDTAEAATNEAAAKRAAFLARETWDAFVPAPRPPVPDIDGADHPVDAFVLARLKSKGLTPNAAADRAAQARRVHLDLTGLLPTPDELAAFMADESPHAWDRLVDRLLASPAYGERWGRHWMDVWRYSDWAGYKAAVRESQKHIWQQEMLAGDELAPGDEEALRGTGFLARNYFRNRDQWMDDVVRHTSQAFMGLTVQCAKCHDHFYDPITAEEYYRLRAIFEPYHVRTDHVRGELNTARNGLPRAYDQNPQAKTYFLEAGDERNPIKDLLIVPGTPVSLGGTYQAEAIPLADPVRQPERRGFVRGLLLEQAASPEEKAALRSLFELEDLAGGTKAEGKAAVTKAKRALAPAKKKFDAAVKAQAAAAKALKAKPSAKYTPRLAGNVPRESTGRRLAYARWLTRPDHPLTARVAANQVWMRHFKTGLVPTVSDFGGNGQPPSHPQLLDWLAHELRDSGWSLKELHRTIVTSDTYRRSSEPREVAEDRDNTLLWRYPPKRMEGELIRDNLLHVAGRLDRRMGGPDIPNTQAQSSLRRSVYLRHAHEKLVEFVQIFDGPKTSECYQREDSIRPQQALALVNSKLTVDGATALAAELADRSADAFLEAAFQRILGRSPRDAEVRECAAFLNDAADPIRGRRNLLVALLNLDEFVMIR